jgi:dolichol-phosphate mannosyltransferase
MALISVVVPVYHNADSLLLLMERLSSAVDLTGDMVEFVFVDDGSGDESFEILQRFAREDQRVRAIRSSHCFGSGRSRPWKSAERDAKGMSLRNFNEHWD